jgi:hypothetical protein
MINIVYQIIISHKEDIPFFFLVEATDAAEVPGDVQESLVDSDTYPPRTTSE